MGSTIEKVIKPPVIRPIASSGNLARLSEAASAATELLGSNFRLPNLDRLEEVFADLPKFRAGFNVAGRVLGMRCGKHLEIELATTEALEEVPDHGPCEMKIIVRDEAKIEDMMSSLNIGDLIEVRGKILPYAYFEGEEQERVVSLTFVANSINVLETAQG
jgi:lysyl-tRNA synthetase class II